VKSSLDPTWQPFDVPLSALCGGDRDTTRALRFQVFDFEKSGDHRLLGEATTTVADLLALRSDVDQSGGSAAEVALAWPKDGPLAEKVEKAKKKGKATEEAGSLLFDVFSLLPGTANDPAAEGAAATDEDQFLGERSVSAPPEFVHIICRTLYEMCVCAPLTACMCAPVQYRSRLTTCRKWT
jgi:hypothetical protein